MFTDQVEKSDAITATHTLTFQSLKFSFFFPEYERFLGKVHIMDIGLSRHFEKTEKAAFELLELNQITKLIIKRKAFSHKGDYGHAALVAGSKGMMGAAILAAKGCLHAGAGKLTCYVPEEGLNIIQTAVPAAMAKTGGKKNKDITRIGADHSVIGLGPGLGRNNNEKELLEDLFSKNIPMVIDADALNALADNKKLLKKIPEDAILTPHPGEFDRLFGTVSNRVHAAVEAAIKYKVYIILKGKNTCIATPEGIGYFNPTGNAGMARGGMGDVLTGLLTGLRSQGYSAKHSCLIGVYLHGLAGDLAAADLSEQALQPEDVIEYFGRGWRLVG
ncbi:MAG: NAD(P)H-hydrate dehydratase [Chitinophagaceae bacterium]|nr:MAG: NAD(P)H-hydrate dehydratase [Chitinophagaceae bacterium]